MSAKSWIASIPSALVSAVWCGPPAVSHASAAVASEGRGRQTARATGSFGSGASASTTSTSLAMSRNRSPRSARPRMTAGPGAASKTSRTGSDLPPIESGWISHDGRSPLSDGQTSSMCAPRTSGTGSPRW